MHEVPILKTARLVMQPVDESDAARLHALWSDPDVRRYLWDDQTISRAAAGAAVRASVALGCEEDLGLWCVSEALASPLIGFVALRHPESSAAVRLGRGLAGRAAGEFVAGA